MAKSTDSLNRIYAEQMSNHPYGYAVYQPNFNSVIKAGTVGYFDPAGIWSPIVDLTDPESLKAAKLSPPKATLRAAPPQKQTWGPMTSKNVTSHNLDSSISPAITGLPLSASLKIKYTSDSTFGAVLVTTPPVTHKAFYFSSPFSDWVKDNAHALLSGEHKEDIRNNGLVVVTQTYDTAKCALTAWTEGKSEAFLGFDVAVPGLGNTGNSGGWHEGTSADGWAEYEANGDDNMVVFVGGIWYDCEKQDLASLFHFDAPAHPNLLEVEPIQVTISSEEKYQLQHRTYGPPLPHN